MDLKALMAEEFHCRPEDITPEQLEAFKRAADRAAHSPDKAFIAPPSATPAPPDAVTRDEFDEFKSEYQARKEATIQFEQQMAEIVSKPKIDPDEGRIAQDRVSRMKTFPVLETFLSKPAQDDNEKALQTVCDDLYTLSVLRGKGQGQVPVRKLQWWEQVKDLQPSLAKALDTATSAEGAEWAPTRNTNQMVDAVHHETVVAQLFPRIEMPFDSYKSPFGLTGGTAYLGGEAKGDDPAEATASTPATAEVEFAAKRIYALFNYSEEVDDNALVPLLPQLREQITRVLAEGIEDAIISGDTTSTHMDSAVGGDSPKRAWDGLRHFAAVTDTTAFKSLATFDGDNIGGVVTALDQQYVSNVEDVVMIWPSASRIDLIFLVDDSTNKTPLFMRSTPLGDNAMLRGEFGNFAGHPCVLSSRMPVNLNASGVYDATTMTKKCMIAANRKAWYFGDRKNITLTVIHEPKKFRYCLLATWRGDFRMVAPSTDTHTGGGYNF